MRSKRALVLSLIFLIVLGIGVFGGFAPQQKAARPGAVQLERVVFLGGKLSDENLITFTSTMAASGHPGVVLFDTPQTGPHLKAFLAAYRAEQVVPVGSFPAGGVGLERRLGMPVAPGLEWERGPPDALWKSLFPQAERVVVSPAEPRGLLLQAACLAGAVRAPLYLVRGAPGEMEDLKRRLADWRTREVFAVGAAGQLGPGLGGVRVTGLADEEATAIASLRHHLAGGPIQTLVVANPADTQEELGGMSALAPWVAVQRRAALLLTNKKGDDVATVVRTALKNPDLRDAGNLILVANLQAIPMERRLNPAPGKDTHVEMEPLTPAGSEPCTFATGRLFHKDPAVVALMLARQRLLAALRTAPRALVVSNPGGSLPLLETFSRNTCKELANAGYRTTTLFGDDATVEKVRRLLPEQNLFLWEGHYRTMVDEYGLPTWSEPLQPSLIFLQSCLALNEAEAQPLLQRGAVAIVGSAGRTYSASGGTFTLAFFDSVLYEDQSLGGALRQAKNFLLAYSMLKEKRLGAEAALGGANVRSAWAFTLWGDPTLKLPRPERPANALPSVRHEVNGKTIVLSLPEKAYDKVTVGRYEAVMLPNARLAGLLTKDEDVRHLVPFLFAEIHLPGAPPDRTPQLHSKIPEKQWVFCWDGQRRRGYLLVTPRSKDRTELRFQVRWQD